MSADQAVSGKQLLANIRAGQYGPQIQAELKSDRKAMLEKYAQEAGVTLASNVESGDVPIQTTIPQITPSTDSPTS